MHNTRISSATSTPSVRDILGIHNIIIHKTVVQKRLVCTSTQILTAVIINIVSILKRNSRIRHNHVI